MNIRSIRTKFLATLLFSLALPFLAFGLFAWVQMRKWIERDFGSLFLQRMAADTARNIEELLEARSRDLRVWTTSPQVRNALEDLQVAELTAWLDQTTENNIYQLLLLAGPDGRVIMRRVSPAGTGREESDDLIPESVSDEDWFRACTTSPSGLWSRDRHLSRYLRRNPEAEQKDPNVYSIGFASVVRDDTGNPAGALLCLVNWLAVQSILDEVATYCRETRKLTSGYAFLFASDADLILAHHDRGIYNTSVRRNHHLDVLSDAIQASAGEGYLEYEYPPGTPKISGWKQLDPRYRDPFGWYVGVGVNNADIFKTAEEFRTIVIAGIVLVFLGTLVWALMVSRIVMRPVAALRTATARLSSGDMTARVEVDGGDELGDLGKAFNKMAGELDQSRQDLRRAERDAAWAEMARQVAHEIKNPLTPMRLSAQMLEKALAERSELVPEIGQKTVRTILSQTEALRKIAADFSRFAGRPKRELAPVSVDGCLAAVAELYAAGEGGGRVPVVTTPGAGATDVLADREDLIRVLINLVNNSIDAMEQAGKNGSVRVTSHSDGEFAEIVVEDEGPGLSSEALEHLFEPYFSTKSHGTGLGLAIVKRTVESFGGKVTIGPREGGGTRAVVTLKAL